MVTPKPADAEQDLLEVECSYYDEHFDDFVRDYPGEHLVITGRKLLGHFPTRDEAIVLAYSLGKRAVLVRESGTREPKVFLPTTLSA